MFEDRVKGLFVLLRARIVDEFVPLNLLYFVEEYLIDGLFEPLSGLSVYEIRATLSPGQRRSTPVFDLSVFDAGPDQHDLVIA